MITKAQDPVSLGEYAFDVAVGKRDAGDVPLFSSLNQMQSVSATLDTEATAGNTGDPTAQIKQFVSKVEAVWRLNANPLVRIVAGLPLDQLFAIVDFNGFGKNGVLGLRFRKEQLEQSSAWIYGTIQYATPRFENERRNVLIEGYGLLFEAARRQESRNFKSLTALSIISVIAKKYNLGLLVRGELPDAPVLGPEQNESDFTLLCQMTSILDAYWYLEDTNLVLIGRDYMYNQTPDVTLTYGTQLTENLGVQFPLTEFSPMLDARGFEAGAIMIRAMGIDLDTGEIVQKDIRPEAVRLGPLALNSDQFLSDKGVTVNGIVVRPAPLLETDEAGVVVPLRTRSNDEQIYRFAVEHKDLSVRALAVCSGLPKLRPGALVKVAGVGELFGGNWVVEEITHRIGDGQGYNSFMILTRNALGQINAPTNFGINVKAIEDRPESTVRKFARVDV